jgi:hypothetical protein
MSSPKLFGMPVLASTTSRTPSGGFLCKSRTSRATRARVLGGKFSVLLLLARLYWRYDAVVVVAVVVVDGRAVAEPGVDMMV